MSSTPWPDPHTSYLSAIFRSTIYLPPSQQLMILQIKRWYTFLKYKTVPGSFWEFFSDVNLPTTGQSLSLRNLIWKYYVPFFLVFVTDNFSFVLRNNNQTPRWRGRRVPCFRHLGHRGKGKYPWSIHKSRLQSTIALRTYRYNATFQVELCVTHYCFHCIFACEYSFLFSLLTII